MRRLGKNVFRAVPLARGPEIESLVEVFLAEVRSKRPTREVSRELHKLLLQPISEHLDKKGLIIVPDGKLHLLPFDALVAADGRRVRLGLDEEPPDSRRNEVPTVGPQHSADNKQEAQHADDSGSGATGRNRPCLL